MEFAGTSGGNVPPFLETKKTKCLIFFPYFPRISIIIYARLVRRGVSLSLLHHRQLGARSFLLPGDSYSFISLLPLCCLIFFSVGKTHTDLLYSRCKFWWKNGCNSIKYDRTQFIFKTSLQTERHLILDDRDRCLLSI